MTIKEKVIVLRRKYHNLTNGQFFRKYIEEFGWTPDPESVLRWLRYVVAEDRKDHRYWFIYDESIEAKKRGRAYYAQTTWWASVFEK